MHEIISVLNQIIQQENLEIMPFNEQGLSSTPLSNNALFIYCNLNAQDLCFYTRGMYFEDWELKNPELLLALLRLTGPASAYPGYAIGFDRQTNNLWISSHLPLDQTRSDVFTAKLQDFMENAFKLQTLISETLTQVQVNSDNSSLSATSPLNSFSSPLSGSSTSIGTPAQSFATQSAASQSTQNNAQSSVNNQELLQLMSSSNFIWG